MKTIIFSIIIMILATVFARSYNNVVVYKAPMNTHKLKVSVKEKGADSEKVYILSVKPETIITVRPVK